MGISGCLQYGNEGLFTMGIRVCLHCGNKGGLFYCHTCSVCDYRYHDCVTGAQNYAMVVCRSHDTAWSLAHGVFISRPTGKSRRTDKIQTHW